MTAVARTGATVRRPPDGAAFCGRCSMLRPRWAIVRIDTLTTAAGQQAAVMLCIGCLQ